MSADLDRLAALKGRFSAADEAAAADLLGKLSRRRFQDPPSIICLHEIALFLRAYPASRRIARLADDLLGDLRGTSDDAFEDPEISGIAGTTFTAIFSHEVARRLLARYRRAISIDWDRWDSPENLGHALRRRIPLFADDWPVEANVPFRAWLGRRDARWLAENLGEEEFDALHLPLKWDLGASPAARGLTRWPSRSMYYHRGPLIRRSEVSLERELNGPPLAVEKLAGKTVDRLMNVILDTSAVRFRELYGFTWPDTANVLRADLGRGMEFVFFGTPPARRLPLRAYHCGMFFKNGVPAGYVETLTLFERMEVGFNLYYTFREGETAWLYARLLRLFKQLLGVTCFSVDPYQIGLENEEAIESGAFWFYRKFGFRPQSPETARICAREESKIASDPAHRTPAHVLRKLAQAPMIYGGGHEWDGFSVRNLGLRGWKISIEGILRAKYGPTESRYVRMLKRDDRLRATLLRRGRS